MIALLLTLGAFLVFWLIGLAVLVTARANTTSLRIVLTAPVLGTATIVLPLFVLSNFGASMHDGAPTVVAVLFIGSTALLAVRRPRLPLGVVPVFGLCIVGLLLTAWPMFGLGFRWIANANDDMANYVLSATKLLDGGLLAPLDVAGLSRDRNYDAGLQVLHSIGARPGADIMLAAFSAVTGRPPFELFMPLIVALHLCVVCGAAALAMQASRRWWAASVAAGLLVVSPLATYGVVQQLLPQVWGLALAAALLALLIRPELHRDAGPTIRELVPIGLLAAALVAVYVELASTLVVAYALYVAILAVRRELGLRAVVRLWAPTLALVAVALNTYLVREVEFVLAQAGSGLSTATGTSLFGFALVPAALPAILGLQPLVAGSTDPYLAFSIAIAAVLLLAVAVAALVTARRGAAASVILVAYIAIALFLHAQSSDFGLFKLYMYVQPFLAAAAAVWISMATRRSVLAVAVVPLALLVAVQISNQYDYVDGSRNPIDLRNASARSLLPAFRGFFADARRPVISVTENPTLAKLEAAGVGNRPLHLLSGNILEPVLRTGYLNLQSTRLRRDVRRVALLDGWEERAFDLLDPSVTGDARFDDNTYASVLLSGGRCAIVLPTGTQLALNRLALPEGSPSLVARRCREPRNLLAFTVSNLGQSYYLPGDRKAVSFYQLERDYFFRGRTLTGFGRYALFRVLGPSDQFRLELDLTTSLRQDGSNRLPPAAAVGTSRTRLPLLGRGSARVFSPPLRPQLIGGQPYVLLDMGEDGRISRASRSGLEGLYGSSVPLDPRYLTSYVRDISLVSDADYAALDAPSKLERFPDDLANPDLEYSGIYEDGWVSERSYVMLAGGPRRDLVVRAQVLAHDGQHLDVLVDGRRVASRNVAAGPLELRVPVPASAPRRRIELRWASATPLQAPDRRRASALLQYIGLVRASR